MACLDFSLLYRLEDRVNQRLCRLRERNLTDDECLRVEFFNFGTYFQYATSLSVIVFRDIDGATCGEVGEELERLVVQVGDSRVADLHEVMGQNFRRQAYSDTLGTLSKQQWELHRQGDRFLVPAVIRHLPFCGLGIEDGVEGEFRQACLDISGSSRFVACQDITPVTLCVHQQLFLSQLYQSVTDGGVTMRMKLHGMSHDIRYFVEPAVIHTFHGVQDTSLYGFQSVLDMWNGTVEDGIRGIVQKPVLVHATQMVYGGSVEAVDWLIVRVSFGVLGKFGDL